MKTLTEYIEEQEQKEILKEGILNIMGNVLGIGTVGVLYAWAGAMLLKGGIGAVNSIAGALGKKGIQFKSGIKSIKNSPSVKNEENEMIELRKKYGEEIKDITNAIKNDDVVEAAALFKGLPIAKQNSTEIRKLIVEDVIKATKQIPVCEPTPGNKCYKFLRTLFGMKPAQAMARAFQDQVNKISNIED